MVRSHTYFLARRPKGSCTFGALKDNEAIAKALEELYEQNKGEADMAIVDGSSLWIDAAGAVQSRVIAGGVARAIELSSELVRAVIAASEGA
jgi:hypothetical protein